MEFIPYKDNCGERCAVNLDGMRHLVRENIYANALLSRSKPEVVEKHWIGPDMKVVNTNWDGLRKEIEHESKGLFDEIDNSLMSSRGRSFYVFSRLTQRDPVSQ
jgi:hypothetical protein